MKHFYKFSNGPFKHAMIALGYNPLADPKSIYFQTVATNKKMNLSGMDNSDRKKSNFLQRKKYVCFQLGEINNGIIKVFIEEYYKANKQRARFDYVTGWFTKEAFRNLKKLIGIKMQ